MKDEADRVKVFIEERREVRWLIARSLIALNLDGDAPRYSYDLACALERFEIQHPLPEDPVLGLRDVGAPTK